MATDPEASTRASAHADLRLLIEAADVIPSERAKELATWAMRTFRAPERYIKRSGAHFLVHDELIAMVGALVETLDPDTQADVADFVLDLPGQPRAGLVEEIEQLISRRPDSVWTPEHAERAAVRARERTSTSYALLAGAARHVPDAHDQLLSEARNGSLAALAALDDFTPFESSEVNTLVGGLVAAIDEQLTNAARGLFALGGPDYGCAVVLINLSRPECANWDVIYRLIEAPAWRYQLARVLGMLAGRVADLSAQVARASCRLLRRSPRHPRRRSSTCVPIPGQSRNAWSVGSAPRLDRLLSES